MSDRAQGKCEVVLMSYQTTLFYPPFQPEGLDNDEPVMTAIPLGNPVTKVEVRQ